MYAMNILCTQPIFLECATETNTYIALCCIQPTTPTTVCEHYYNTLEYMLVQSVAPSAYMHVNFNLLNIIVTNFR